MRKLTFREARSCATEARLCSVGVVTSIGGGVLAGAVGLNMLGMYFGDKGAGDAADAAAGGYMAAGNILSPAELEAGRIQSEAATESAGILSKGAKAGAEQQVAGLKTGMQTVADTLAQQKLLQQPFQSAGTSALQELSAKLAPGGDFNRPFTMADAQNMPAYQFALSQGKEAINNAAAAGGLQLSSANIESLGKFAEGVASQYEQQAFNQWLQQNNLTMTGLQNLINSGQVSTGQLMQALSQAGISTASAQQLIGQAQAGGTTGAAEAEAAGVTGSAAAKAAGITGSASALASGLTGAAGARAQEATNKANVMSSGLTGIGSLVLGAGLLGL